MNQQRDLNTSFDAACRDIKNNYTNSNYSTQQLNDPIIEENSILKEVESIIIKNVNIRKVIKYTFFKDVKANDIGKRIFFNSICVVSFCVINALNFKVVGVIVSNFEYEKEKRVYLRVTDGTKLDFGYKSPHKIPDLAIDLENSKIDDDLNNFLLKSVDIRIFDEYQNSALSLKVYIFINTQKLNIFCDLHKLSSDFYGFLESQAVGFFPECDFFLRAGGRLSNLWGCLFNMNFFGTYLVCLLPQQKKHLYSLHYL